MTKHKKPTNESTPESEEAAKLRAEVATRAPTINAMAALRFAGIVGEQAPDALALEIGARIKEVIGGDMREPERMLMGQAVALQTIFANLASRAAMNVGEYMGATEIYLRLALKAQSQCRATLETLVTLKNPPVVIAKQANVTTGPQQINNGVAPPRAGEFPNEPNKLLEAQHGQWLDTGTTGTTSGVDPHMEAVGVLNGAAHG